MSVKKFRNFKKVNEQEVASAPVKTNNIEQVKKKFINKVIETFKGDKKALLSLKQWMDNVKSNEKYEVKNFSKFANLNEQRRMRYEDLPPHIQRAIDRGEMPHPDELPDNPADLTPEQRRRMGNMMPPANMRRPVQQNNANLTVVNNWLEKFDGVGDRWDEEGLRELENEWGRMSQQTKMRIVRQAMGAVPVIEGLERGHEDELKEIAKLLIERHFQENPSEYSEYIEQIKLNLDIDKPTNQDMKGKEEDEEEDDEDEEENDNVMNFGDFEIPEEESEPMSEEDKENAIFKRDVANSIMQAMAHKSFTLLAKVKDELDAINPELYTTYMAYGSASKFLYWLESRPEFAEQIHHFAEMLNQEGPLGTTEVQWEDEDDDEDNDNQEEQEEQEQEDKEESPTIKAKGINLPVLVHEIIKGLYEVALSGSIPEDKGHAKEVLSETDTIINEFIQFRYGTSLLKDILGYAHNNSNTEYLINELSVPVFEVFLFNKLMELNASDFKEQILNIIHNRPATMVDDIIDNWVNEYKQSQLDQALGQEEIGDMTSADAEKEFSGEDEGDIYSQLGINKPTEQSDDPSTWTQAEIKAKIDELIDAGNFEEIAKYSQYLNEALKFSDFIKIFKS